MAVGQNQSDCDVHWGYGILTHGTELLQVGKKPCYAIISEMHRGEGALYPVEAF